MYATVQTSKHRSATRNRTRGIVHGDQRFFLGYAQSWRHKSTDESTRQLIVSNPHAPAKYRVNGVVRNMDAWYEAFNVNPSDQLFLAPENRARIW